ncbi:hypothetical protein [Kiloniella sp.]|uniref:hypothetical protein n=1 Tax=Kiloniella sp. TaxID=1938587 RepID=UPI003B014C3A
MTTHIRNAKFFARNWTLLWALGFSIVVGISMWLSQGHLIYTRDDPYIHLSVAENIIKGGYGVNLTEFSSPSSSILYPLLLSITEFVGLGSIGPLFINSLATGLSVWLLLEFFWRYAIPEETPHWAIFPNAIAPLLILSINGLALPLTGMEHSLHVLAVLVTLRGLVLISENGQEEPIPKWLLLAIIVGPLIRFEGMALSGAAVLALFVQGHRQTAFATGTIIIALICLYGLIMHQLGLPLLPSSVMVKSNVFTTGTNDSYLINKVYGLVENLRAAMVNRWGGLFALAIGTLLFMGIKHRKNLKPTAKSADTSEGISLRSSARFSPEFIIGSTIGLSLCAHLVAGQYNWFHRYEVYAVAILIIGGLYLLRHFFHKLMQARLFLLKTLVLCGLTLLIKPYFIATELTPLASRGIYEQQFQMHRFATEFFSKPFAVNDLGWVSYNNDNYVLDLWGLGSERVRKIRATDKLDTQTMHKLVQDANVDYAMVYKQWFTQGIPKSWCLLATMKTEIVSAAEGSVQFYATNPAAVPKMHSALDQFSQGLSNRVILERSTCPAMKVTG